MNKAEIKEVVFQMLEDLNATLEDAQKFEISEELVLFGHGSSIDSLTLVSLVVDLETAFSDMTHKEISLTNDRAMTRTVSPFKNVNSLVEYLFEIINE
jgi:acyl carrier protein